MLKKDIKEKMQYIQKNVFTGRHSVIIVMGFTISGTIIARSIWQYLYNNIGLGYTMLVGFIIFLLTGIYMHKFFSISKNTNSE